MSLSFNCRGGCYRVFPGASHNRFEHCIGTCYLAGRLVKSLRKRQPELGITDEDMLCVRIAGLCHDLGHGPFSHTFGALFIPTARPDAHWKHEDASVRMFDHMMMRNKLSPSFEKYNLTERDVTFIKELIAATVLETTICTSEDWPYKGRGPEKSYLYEIVANKRTGIDVDKFDYFSRDCHCLGINNSFDHKRYMKFARVINVSGKLQICVRDKEAGNVYDMFHTRNSLFRRAYQHKTSNIIERMITEALLKADRKVLFKGSNGKMFSISECIDDMEAYSQLSDHVYYQILNSSDPALEEARKILLRIQRRDLYKCIGHSIFRERRDEKEIPDIQLDIAGYIEDGPKLDPEDFIIDMVTFDYGMKDRNPIDEVRFYGKSNPDKPLFFRKDEVSNMLPEMFAEQHIRVYFRKNDPKLLEKAQRCFLRWCGRQKCTTPKGGDALAELTPMKSAQQGGPSNMERRLSYQE
ncbi:deoxynucleoside triphosphate triphosphohydrolase SAMHD1-like isoform X2 [Pocillopora damicornis]|uniref:deoxynucleoside triphosphate triphosphohydrolase SAMHD1-like isoform X2 n=1 Tax=Pocillopora damicornis TaxID=46731 RepID=UPI000F54EC68|nr:deoxynucleoside triphosphate triphosphohydrolase SAMHD1-like isoform X2 [Pocillopora damicornis]